MKKAIKLSFVMLLICGILYPLVLTGISQIAFNNKANGSIIEVNGKELGSKIVGQAFEDSRFFKGRPSNVNYNTYEDKNSYKGVATGSSNLAPTNPELVNRIKKDLNKFLEENPSVKLEDIPSDILTQSGSGLDPHISVEGAKVQISRVSKSTGISEGEIQKIVDKNTNSKLLGVFGEKTVNVLGVNIEIAKKLGLI